MQHHQQPEIMYSRDLHQNQNQHQKRSKQVASLANRFHHQNYNNLPPESPTSQHLHSNHNVYYETTTAIEPDKSASINHHPFQDFNGKKIFIVECLGTCLFVYLSQCSITSFELIGTQNDTISRYLATIIARSLALLFATVLTLNVTNSHLNPAYSLASSLFGYIKFSDSFNRIVAQYLGSFLASILLHLTYYDKLNQRHHEGLLIGKNITQRSHGNLLSTGKFFSSFPPTEVSHFQLFTSYLLANIHFALLSAVILEGNLLISHRKSFLQSIKPIYLALSIGLILAAFSANGGPVLNPAQDFSTRLYMLFTAWGSSAFNLYNGNYWWLCGLIAPHFGFIIGFSLYKLFSELHKPSLDYARARLRHGHHMFVRQPYAANSINPCQNCIALSEQNVLNETLNEEEYDHE